MERKDFKRFGIGKLKIQNSGRVFDRFKKEIW